MKAVRVHECGGPEALRYEEVAAPTPGRGEALVKIAASGVNFIDVQQRAGRYKPPRCRSRSARKARAPWRRSDPT